ncbi:MAG: glycerate kinase [Desulfobulbus propionicus]|nr:MAG: glycerate kinase [Desulfobulbus propionicus]
MKIVVAPNAFKGSLAASEVAAAMAEGLLAVLPDAQVRKIPVADGGNGLLDVFRNHLKAEVHRQTVTGPRGKPVKAALCYLPSSRTAFVEMALASGLALLSPAEYNPGQTTTRGTGELIRAALDLGAVHILVGLGGSATNDGGTGMATVLGARFLDRHGQAITPTGDNLETITTMDLSAMDPRLKNVHIEAACDVDNPLTGPRGAARVYGPQKGATPEQVNSLDAGLVHLATLLNSFTTGDISQLPGAGAAGGLGAGLHAFTGAALRPGTDVVLEVVGLEKALQEADLVLTGEGQIDEQTAFGKAPAGVARLARRHGIPCLAVAGSRGQDLTSLHALGINAVFSLCPGPISLEEAMTNSTAMIRRATEQVLRCFLAGQKV